MQNKIELLVSPKDLQEASICVEAGVKYIDCKNPSEGSLGANFPWIIKGMRELIPKHSTQLLSATIGDFPNLPGSASLAALGAAISGADLIKIGLKGPENKEQAIKLMNNVVRAVKDYNSKIKVVAAGYADRSRMKTSPQFLEIPNITAESGADIAMLDTFIKDDKNLFDFLSVDELIEFKCVAKDLNINIALAGNIMKKDIKKIKKIKPDILGVRRIVCEGFDRNNGKIKKELIQNLNKELYE